MTIISNKIDEIFLLPAAEKELFLSRLERKAFTKGDLIISADRIERYVYFIESGIARAFCQNEKGQTTIWFGEEGDVMLS
ncbi:MAG: Crp/Fnr family transcriptional regulator, partial [Pedobacter sp.]